MVVGEDDCNMDIDCNVGSFMNDQIMSFADHVILTMSTQTFKPLKFMPQGVL